MCCQCRPTCDWKKYPGMTLQTWWSNKNIDIKSGAPHFYSSTYHNFRPWGVRDVSLWVTVIFANLRKFCKCLYSFKLLRGQYSFTVLINWSSIKPIGLYQRSFGNRTFSHCNQRFKSMNKPERYIGENDAGSLG